jgi:hypothetical protein
LSDDTNLTTQETISITLHHNHTHEHLDTFSPGTASSEYDSQNSVSLDSLGSHENNSLALSNDGIMSVTRPNSSAEIDPPNSPDSCDDSDLALFVEWSKKGRCTIDDDTPVTIKCDDHSLFMSCAQLLKPYMKKHRSAHTEEEISNLKHVLDQISDSLKSEIPTERYKIAQQLNILAMFKGELTFIKGKIKKIKKTYERVTCTLADRFRIGESRRNPMQMQNAQIESGVITAEEAALTLFTAWKNEDVLDKRVKSCRKRLRSNGFYRYQWPDNELVDILTYRSDKPRIVKKLNYSENKIRKFCKRIRKKGRHKSEYIENIALLIAAEWRSKGVLNEAIADCTAKLKNAKATIKIPESPRTDITPDNTTMLKENFSSNSNTDINQLLLS